jgi:hypothetical protein
MGQPIVHFEIVGKDGEKIKNFYSQMFGWEIDSNNPMNYGMVAREGNVTSDGIGIGGGISGSQEGHPGYVTVYVEVPDVEASLAQAESLGSSRLMGPEKIMEGVEIGLFSDPEGNTIGLIKGGS